MGNEEDFVELAEIREDLFNLAKDMLPYIEEYSIYMFACMFLAKVYVSNKDIYQEHYNFVKEMQSKENNQRKDIH